MSFKLDCFIGKCACFFIDIITPLNWVEGLVLNYTLKPTFYFQNALHPQSVDFDVKLTFSY